MKKIVVPCAMLAVILVSTTVSNAFPRHPVPHDPIETMMIGWEHTFTLEWAAEPTSERTTRVRGYVINHYGGQIDHMRLLAQAIDASGTVVGKQMSWVPGGVNSFGGAYFEIRGLPSATRYRVTVWDYDVLQS